MSGRFSRTIVKPNTWTRRQGEPSGNMGAMGVTGIITEAPSGAKSSDGRMKIPSCLPANSR